MAPTRPCTTRALFPCKCDRIPTSGTQLTGCSYLSKAPGSVKDYDGSGGWFKVKDWGPSGGQWAMQSTYSFNIPSCVPAGEYLVRIQSLGIHNPWPAGIPQFYVGCAQVKVTGGGSANPPTVKIPGVFKESDSGYTANVRIASVQDGRRRC